MIIRESLVHVVHHVMMVMMPHQAVMSHHMMPMFSLHMIFLQIHFLVLHFVFGGGGDDGGQCNRESRRQRQ